MFSAVLLVFELRLHKIDAFVADNFGFLFSWNGRAFFLFLYVFPLIYLFSDLMGFQFGGDDIWIGSEMAQHSHFDNHVGLHLCQHPHPLFESGSRTIPSEALSTRL